MTFLWYGVMIGIEKDIHRALLLDKKDCLYENTTKKKK